MEDSALRSDAARNRERILVAAREVFAEEGLEVSMRAIARRAQVGEPTLRRRFDSREQLVAEAFEDKVAAYADLAREGLLRPRAADGMRDFLDGVLDMQLGDRGLADVLTTTFPASMRCEQHRRQAYRAIEQLTAAARDAGALRGDFVAEDVVMLLLAHAGVVAGAGPVATQMSARWRALVMESLGLSAPAPLPPAPSAGRTYRALMRLHPHR